MGPNWVSTAPPLKHWTVSDVVGQRCERENSWLGRNAMNAWPASLWQEYVSSGMQNSAGKWHAAPATAWARYYVDHRNDDVRSARRARVGDRKGVPIREDLDELGGLPREEPAAAVDLKSREARFAGTDSQLTRTRPAALGVLFRSAYASPRTHEHAHTKVVATMSSDARRAVVDCGVMSP